MIELLLNSIRILFRKKGRTFLTLSGIMVGVASVIIISSVSICGGTALTNEISSLGVGGLMVTQKNEGVPLSENELNAVKSTSYADYAMPLIFETTEVYIREKKTPVFLWGIDKTASEVLSLKLYRGRFFNNGDVSSLSKVCLIDSKFAKKYFGTENAVNKKLIINSGGISSEYTVVGVLYAGSGMLQNMMGSFIPDFLYIPYTTMQNNTSGKNYSEIAVRVNSKYDNDTAGEKIIKVIERSNGHNDSYMVTNMDKQKENLNQIIIIFSVVLSAIGCVSLIVSGLGIMNIMLVSVNERTREIGIKKSLGAGKKFIIAEFLTESAFLTLMGSLMGIVAGYLISFIGIGAFGLTLSIRGDIIFGVILFSLFIGIVFGIYPALKASRLCPADALRHS